MYMHYVNNTNFITNPKVCLSAFLISWDNYSLAMRRYRRRGCK